MSNSAEEYKGLVTEAHFQSIAWAVLEHLLTQSEAGSVEHWVLEKLRDRAVEQVNEARSKLWSLADQFNDLLTERQQKNGGEQQ